MPDKQSEQAKGNALLRIIQTVAAKSSKGIMYTVAVLGAMALIPGVELPAALSTLALSLGVEMIGSLIDRVAHGDEISDDEIERDIEVAVTESGIGKPLTREDFDCVLDHLRAVQRALHSDNVEILGILRRLESIVSSTDDKTSPTVIRDTRVDMDVVEAQRVVGVEVDRPAVLSNVRSKVRAQKADVAIGIQIGPFREKDSTRSVHRLPIIPKPDENTRTVLERSEDADSTILLRSSGDIDYVCGNCGALLIEGVREGQVQNVVLHCNRCGSYNDLVV